MAKDGTVRGGLRQGAGRKLRDANEKISEGKEVGVIDFSDIPIDADEIEGDEMPEVDEWIKEAQHNGEGWSAEELTKRTYKWLKARNCEKLVTMEQIYSYAVAEARWIQSQRGISRFGFIAKHPTTGAPIESPYIRAADKFFKQASAAWFQIYQVVRENCTEAYNGMNPHEQAMAALLSD